MIHELKRGPNGIPYGDADQIFNLVLIRPTHYDDDGYPIQWVRSLVPSNSLACMHGIAVDCAKRRVLGPTVRIRIHLIDESNRRVNAKVWARRILKTGAGSLVAFVGVQSNQFPRAVDLGRQFVKAGIPVCIGGFHVSGTVAALGTVSPEIQQAQASGISFFAGEAECRRLDKVLQDALSGKMKPLYNHLNDLPNLSGQPLPFLPVSEIRRTLSGYASFDLGRGCPYNCSFCTITSVQGRKSRCRSADDLEAMVRYYYYNGVRKFFLTDDNFARNRNWEQCLDRLIELRLKENIRVRITAQVDTECYKIPGFIDKAVRAGVDSIFIGIESLNPNNLMVVNKKQNRVTDYRRMMLTWKKHPVVITVGYIIGLPEDTQATIARDIQSLKRDLPVDLVYFTFFTPLPGSAEYHRVCRSGQWLDPDLNKFDLNHRVTHHPVMSDLQWDKSYSRAWREFYTRRQMDVILRRMAALRSNKKLTTLKGLLGYREFKRQVGIHPLEGGLLRLKYRKDRRPGLALEGRMVFYVKYAVAVALFFMQSLPVYFWLRWRLYKIWGAPENIRYRDRAIAVPDRYENMSPHTSAHRNP